MELIRRLFRPKYPAITKDNIWPDNPVGYTVTRYNEYGLTERQTYNEMTNPRTLFRKKKIIPLKKPLTIGDEIYNFVMNFNGTVTSYGGVWLRIHKRVKPELYDHDYLDISIDERATYQDGHLKYIYVYIIKHGKHGDISDLFNPEEIKNMHAYLQDKAIKQAEDNKMNDLKDFIKSSPAPGSVVIKK